MPKKKRSLTRATASQRKGWDTLSLEGELSRKKGLSFEEKVFTLYQAIGADVIQNITIAHKEIDLFVQLPIVGSPRYFRILVECKSGKPKNQRQIVREFSSIMREARLIGKADAAEIITSERWGEHALGTALENDIGLMTYNEKLAKLVDLNPYLRKTIERFEERDPARPSDPPLGAYYVDSKGWRKGDAGEGEVVDLKDYVLRWLSSEGGGHIALLGEYGIGKSSFCQSLARDLARECIDNSGSCRIPFLLNLREFTKTLRIEALISLFLDEECDLAHPRFQLFKLLNDEGMLALILDGLDEMAVRVDSDVVDMNLQEIEKLAISPKSKLLLTSRPEYFINAEEESRVLRPRAALMEGRSIHYNGITICNWDDQQIDRFLKRRIALIKDGEYDWTLYKDSIKRLPGLSDLSQRPVLLEMMAQTLPEFISTGKEIGRPNLYDTYLRAELRRQKVIKRRGLLIDHNTRFDLLKQLALDFYKADAYSISFEGSMKRIEEMMQPPRSEREYFTRDFLTCSFLIRKGDYYRFSHQSIMEFLIAKRLEEEISEEDFSGLSKKPLTPVIRGFLLEMGPRVDYLVKWLESSRSESFDRFSFLGGNCFSLLWSLDRKAVMEVDLKGCNLRGVVLSDTRLHDLTLAGADLSQAKLRCVVFEDVDCSRCDFRGADLSGSVLVDLDLVEAKFTDATLIGADLSGADLNRARLNRANLLNCKLDRVSLREVDLTDARLAGVSLESSTLAELNLAGANLEKANLANSKCYSVIFDGAKMKRARVSKGKFVSSSFISTDLTEAFLDEASLAGALLRDATLSRACLTDVDLEGADLRGANLEEAILDSGNLSRADLSRSKLQQASAVSVVMEKACLSRCNLVNASLKNANLRFSDLRDARLQSSNLEGANLEEVELNQRTNFSNARYSKATVFPEKFDPRKKGMIIQK